VVLLLPCVRGEVGGVKHCWYRCSSILPVEISVLLFFRLAF